MPGHVYVLCGDYQRAVEISRDAIAADQHNSPAPPFNYYTTSRCHDLHLMMYASMMTGQFQSAIMAADEMCENSLRLLSVREASVYCKHNGGIFSMRMHVVRFGKWQDIIDTRCRSLLIFCVRLMPRLCEGSCVRCPKKFDAAEEHKTLFYAT